MTCTNRTRKFEVGQSITLREGNDLAFIATGETVVHCLLAAGELAESGIHCRVISMHTVKPLDSEAVLNAGRECNAVITVEEHMVNGGLGEACAGILAQSGTAARFQNRGHSRRGNRYRRAGGHFSPLRN